MIRTTTLITSCLAGAILVFPAPASPKSSQPHACVAGNPTPASSTWDFKTEANNTFQALQEDVQQASYDADQLQEATMDNSPDWEIQGESLDALRDDVNDIGARLCRLETIRRVLSPWQQKAVDRIASTTVLLADNTQSEIKFGNAHPQELWQPFYRGVARDMVEEAQILQRSVNDAVAYAHVSQEYRGLQKQLGVATKAAATK